MATAPGVAEVTPDASTEELDQMRLAGSPNARLRSATSDAALFTASTYAAQALTFVAGLLQKGLLGPLGAGYWALMQSFWTYLAIAPMGTMAGTGRQIPAYRGRGDYEGAADLANSGSSFSVLAVGIAGAVLAAVAAIAGGGWPDEIRWGLVLLGVTGPLRLFSDSHKSIIQATKRFDAASITTVVEAAGVLTLQTAAVLLFGFYGMFVGIVLSIALMYAVWRRLGLTTWRRPAFAWRINRRRVRELMSYGFPLAIQGQVWILFMSVDNLIVAGFLSVKDLGYYALGVSVSGYVLHLPRSIGAALFPRMTEKFGETNDINSIRHFVVDTQRVLAYMLVPLFLGAAFYLVPVLITHALPEFEPAIPVVHIIVAASFLIALWGMPLKLLNAAGYRWGITALALFCLAANAGANYVAVAVLDWGLEGAAGATALSYLVTFLLITTYSLSRAFTPRQVAGHIGELLLVWAYVLGLVWGIEVLVGSGDGNLPAGAREAGAVRGRHDSVARAGRAALQRSVAAAGADSRRR